MILIPKSGCAVVKSKGHLGNAGSYYLLYRRGLVDSGRLTTTGWEQHAEILTQAVGRANSMYEVPISYYGRTYDEGKKIKARHIVAVIWTIFMKRLTR